MNKAWVLSSVLIGHNSFQVGVALSAPAIALPVITRLQRGLVPAAGHHSIELARKDKTATE